MSTVTAVPAAPSAAALDHFEAILAFETDCWDVHDALTRGEQDFVLLDVRAGRDFERGHIRGALHLPHGKIVAAKLAAFPSDAMFVTYCAGPHCNAATRAAIRLARLGRSVKTMPGGVTGWIDEGFSLDGSKANTLQYGEQ